MGRQRRMNQFSEGFFRDMRDLQRGPYRFENGGETPLFENGGSFMALPFEKMATDNYIVALPPQMEYLANAEIEDDEYIITPEEEVKKAAGKTHEEGGNESSSRRWYQSCF